MQLEVIAAEHSQQHSQGCSTGRAMSPKARTSAVPDRSEIGPYLGGGSAKQRRSYHPLANLRRAPEVGRCLRQRHVCSTGPLGDRSLPQRPFGQTTQVLPPTGQSPASSGGRAMSPTAPRPQRRVHGAGPLGDRSLPQRRFGQTTQVLPQAGHSQASSGGRAMSPTAPRPQSRTARRSVPTTEAVRGRNAGLTTKCPISGKLRGANEKARPEVSLADAPGLFSSGSASG